MIIDRFVYMSSLLLKYRYKAPGLNSARAAMSVIVEFLNPFLENSWRAASRMTFSRCFFSRSLLSLMDMLSSKTSTITDFVRTRRACPYIRQNHFKQSVYLPPNPSSDISTAAPQVSKIASAVPELTGRTVRIKKFSRFELAFIKGFVLFLCSLVEFL